MQYYYYYYYYYYFLGNHRVIPKLAAAIDEKGKNALAGDSASYDTELPTYFMPRSAQALRRRPFTVPPPQKYTSVSADIASRIL